VTQDNRKRLLVGIGSLVGGLIVALLALPALIDVDAYKPAIVEKVKGETGRVITLEGPIRLSLLPIPSVELESVKLANPPGSKTPNMLEVKSVIVRPSLLALLTGNVEIAEVVLVEPRIALEVDGNGKPNWEIAPSVAEKTSGAAAPLSPGRLFVDNGTLSFNDVRAGLSLVAEKARFDASVGSIEGPFSVTGGALVGNAPLRIRMAVGARSAAGHALDVALEAGGGRLSFKGSADELSPSARVSGTASASADNLVAFAGTLLKMAGQPQPHLPPLLAGKFRFDGPIELSPTSLATHDFKLTLGEDSGSGSFALTRATPLAVEARFMASRLDLDRWLAAIAIPDQLTASPSPVAAAASLAAPPQPFGPSWLSDLNARIALDVGELIYNRKPVRNLALELEARSGVVAVPRFTAVLPGDLTVQAKSNLSGDQARPTASGDFRLVGPKLRETLAWLAVDVSSVPRTSSRSSASTDAWVHEVATSR
jgi:hypothetical protein